jgi:Zn-dependent protease with chaperone function
MPTKLLKLLAFSFLVLGSAAAAADLDSSIAELRAQDERLLRIAEPLLAANAALCDRTMPDLGVSLQSADQYPANAQPAFAAPVGFAVVLPGSAAANAGIERDDGLLSVDGKPVAKRPTLEGSPLRDSAFAAIAEHDPAKPLELGVAHGNAQRVITIAVRPECRALVELLDDNGSSADTDGKVIQVGYGLARSADDGQLAAVLAHELGHLILHHRERLEAGGVHNGFLGGFGRDLRLHIAAEEEADRLSVHLLANAGFDPRVAPGYWRSKLAQRGRNFLVPHKPSPRTRAKLLDAEIAAHSLTAAGQTYPAELLARRAQPLG